MNSILVLLGRSFIALLFAFTAISHATDLAGAQTYLASRGFPVPGLLVFGSILLRLIGVVCVGFGFMTRVGVISLVLYLVFSTFIYYTPISAGMPITPLLKNFALIGGLLILAAHGPGSLAVRKK